MSKVKTGAIPFNVLSTPITSATFSIEKLRLLLAQANCQGIRFFSAHTDVPGVSYFSILALGYDGAGNNMTDMIFLDTMPCPPECHITGVTGTPTTEIELISLTEAQNKLGNPAFSVEFNRTEDLEGMFAIRGATKMRVFYALIPNREATNAQRTFVAQVADQAGEALPVNYLQDDNPAPGIL